MEGWISRLQDITALMSVFLAPSIIVFLITVIEGLPRDSYQYNYASSDGVKKVLDRDMDGDGKADFIMGAESQGLVSILLNRSP